MHLIAIDTQYRKFFSMNEHKRFGFTRGFLRKRRCNHTFTKGT